MTTSTREDIELYNATAYNKATSNNVAKPGFKEYSIFGVRCFTIDIPFQRDVRLLNFYVNLNRSIFPSGRRPAFGVDPILDPMLIIAPHYPNQFYSQINLGQAKWSARRGKNSKINYQMEFNLRNINVYEKRNKYGEECDEGIPYHDKKINRWILKKLGCRPPYWNAMSEMPLCSKFSELKLAHHLLFNVAFGDLKSINYTEIMPCRSFEKVHVDFRDIDDHHSSDSRLEIMYNMPEHTYKEVKSVRSLDMQGFVGNKLLYCLRCFCVVLLSIVRWH